jgi:hypothetical protein
MAMNPLLVAVAISVVIFLIVSYSRYKFNQDLNESLNEVDDLIREYESLIKDEEEDES